MVKAWLDEIKVKPESTCVDGLAAKIGLRIDHDLQYHIEDIHVMAVRSFFHHSELKVETGTLSFLYIYKLLHTD